MNDKHQAREAAYQQDYDKRLTEFGKLCEAMDAVLASYEVKGK